MFGRKKVAPIVPARSSSMSDLASCNGALLAAAQYTTILSGGGRPDYYPIGIRDPLLCSSAAGDGVCFLLESEQGIGGKMYFFSTFSSAWPDGEESPRIQIPTEMIVDTVPNYRESLQALLQLIPRGVDRVARVAH